MAADGAAGEDARRELRDYLVRSLRRMLLGRGVDPSLADDCAQETMLRVRARLDDFRGESRFTTWALAIGTRLLFDELRHRRWQDTSFDALVAAAESPASFELDDRAAPEQQLAQARVLAALKEAIETALTDRQRKVLVAELAGMPHAEIAAQLSMERNALYKLAHDGRKKLKAHLVGAGYSVSDLDWMFA
jgi:RNA polymerase sigma-70 factor (ECF subfamily)